jgi:hypothetical protein
MLTLIMSIIIYGIPAILGGIPVLLIVLFIAWLIGRVKAPNDPTKRKKIFHVGIFVGIILGLVLGLYVFVAVGIFWDSKNALPKSPEEIVRSQFYVEYRRANRDQFWHKGTISELSHWIAVNGGEFKPALRKNLYEHIEARIAFALNFKPEFDIDDNDVAAMEQLAVEFDSTQPLAVRQLLSNFLNIRQNGLRDFSTAFANNDEVSDTYLIMAISVCSKEPLRADCQQHMTLANISTLELRHNDFTAKPWIQDLAILRRAMGIKERNLAEIPCAVRMTFIPYTLCPKTEN